MQWYVNIYIFALHIQQKYIVVMGSATEGEAEKAEQKPFYTANDFICITYFIAATLLDLLSISVFGNSHVLAGLLPYQLIKLLLIVIWVWILSRISPNPTIWIFLGIVICQAILIRYIIAQSFPQFYWGDSGIAVYRSLSSKLPLLIYISGTIISGIIITIFPVKQKRVKMEQLFGKDNLMFHIKNNYTILDKLNKGITLIISLGGILYVVCRFLNIVP